MSKFILAFLLFPFSVQALCLSFYYDANGQKHALRCGPHPEVECAKQDAYLKDGVCHEVEAIKNCKAQGGSWRQVQLKSRVLSIGDVLENPENALKEGFRNTCICQEPLMWDGSECVAELPSALKNDLVNVWCDSLRKDMVIYIPPEILEER